MSSVQTQTPPEAAGPGTPHESGAVRYGQPPISHGPGGLRRGEPPESLGPAVEASGGGLVYGQPGPSPGPMPLPSAEERERERAAAADLIASCACAPVPGGVLTQLRELAQQAGLPGFTGCPRCRSVPPGLIFQLGQALDQARGKAGAAR